MHLHQVLVRRCRGANSQYQGRPGKLLQVSRISPSPPPTVVIYSREIAELNKTKAASESKVVEAALSAEIVLREEIRMAVDKERLLSRQEQDKLQMTIDELRHSIQRSEAQLSRKEQVLRQEVNDLRQVRAQQRVRTHRSSNLHSL